MLQYQIETTYHDPIFGEEITIKPPALTNTKQSQTDQHSNIINQK